MGSVQGVRGKHQQDRSDRARRIIKRRLGQTVPKTDTETTEQALVRLLGKADSHTDISQTQTELRASERMADVVLEQPYAVHIGLQTDVSQHAEQHTAARAHSSIGVNTDNVQNVQETPELATPRSNVRISLEPHHAVMIIVILLCALSLSVTLCVRQGIAFVQQARSHESVWAAQQMSSAEHGDYSTNSSADNRTSENHSDDNTSSSGSAQSAGASQSDNIPMQQDAHNNTHDDTRVDINTADIAMLDTIPGVGPVLAQRIIDYRHIHGNFGSVDELQHVQGIGAKTLENIRPYIRAGTS